MGIGDIFKAKKNKELESKVAELEQLITPDAAKVMELKEKLRTIEIEINEANARLSETERKEQAAKSELDKLLKQTAEKREELCVIENEIEFQDFGLYTPTYKFANSDLYKEKLKNIREDQKQWSKQAKQWFVTLVGR